MKTHVSKNHRVGLALAALLLSIALPNLHAQHRFTRLHSFGATNLAMFAPKRLIEGSDGLIYGTSEGWGGSAVVRLTKDGSDYAVLHAWTDRSPSALLESRDGALYGLTYFGGISNAGTVFKLNKDGTGYTVLREFTGGDGDGRVPEALLEGEDGVLYGVTRYGGPADQGTMFRLNRDGSGCALLQSFPQNSGRAVRPWLLREGSDGVLYGLTDEEWDSSNPAHIQVYSAVFKLKRDGSEFSVLHWFVREPNAGRPVALLEGRDGILYGMTQNDDGYVFRLNRDGTGFSALCPLPGVIDDDHPVLVEGPDEALYGALGEGSGSPDSGVMFRVNKDGTGYTVIHSFRGEPEDTADPRAALLEGTDGALYGTTTEEGESELGTVFRLNKDGTGYAILHRFGASLHDGELPVGPLVESSDGALYGATRRSDLQSGGSAYCGGTIFALNKDGSGYRVVWGFSGCDGDWMCVAGIIEGRDGALYGTTGSGGDLGFGTLFRLEVAPVLYNPVWTGNVFSFQFNARSNAVYQPQFTSNLALSNWTVLPSLTGQHGVVTVTDTNLDAAPRFYRVGVGD